MRKYCQEVTLCDIMRGLTPSFFMSKLLVLPLMLAATAGIMGSTPAEAKPGRPFMFHENPGGRPGTIHRPKKRRCTFKRPCSRMPELLDFGTPMPRGGLRR